MDVWVGFRLWTKQQFHNSGSNDLYNVKELACSDELTENYFSDFPPVGR